MAAERGYVGALGPLLGTCGPGREGGRGVLRAFRGEPSSEPGGGWPRNQRVGKNDGRIAGQTEQIS